MLPCCLEALLNQIKIWFGRRNTGLRFLLKGVQHVDNVANRRRARCPKSALAGDIAYGNLDDVAQASLHALGVRMVLASLDLS